MLSNSKTLRIVHGLYLLEKETLIVHNDFSI